VKNKLTAKAVQNAKPKDRDYKLTDGGGLYLFVTKAGGKYWRYNYALFGKEKTKALGVYPEVSLEAARTAHAQARVAVKGHDDPVEVARTEVKQKAAKRSAVRPFRDVAAEWLAVKYPAQRRAKATINAKRNSIDKLNAAFGDRDIGEVNEVALLAKVLKQCEAKGTYETRVIVQRDAIAIMGYAEGLGLIKSNPFAGVKFAATFTSPRETAESRPALVESDSFGRLLRDIDRIAVTHDRRTRHAPINRLALRILAATFVRPGELAQAEWSWIDWDNRKLVVPFGVLKQRTKRKLTKSARAGKNFEVPLARQVIADLRALQKLTGENKFLFPARPSRWGDLHQVSDQTISEVTLNAALGRIGYKGTHCAHGFRSSASTMLNAERVTVKTADGEELEVPRWPEQKAMVELQLDHVDASVQAIYDRGGRWKERCQLMQLWADRCEEMRGERKGGLRLVA
jgi:integrase